ncbi:MAG: hypothetical protein FJ240_06360 [Nitrospira sp.]|nr:hypothetical protein [Nitrospira sp.]
MSSSDIRKIINRLLLSVADITEREVKLFHFDGELFHPNIGKPVLVYELKDIRLVDEEPIVNKVCLGPTCLDGTPDMRYNYHDWRREEWYSYDLIHGEDKTTRILVGAADSRREVDIASQSFRRLAGALKNDDFAAAYRKTIKSIRDIASISASIAVLEKRLKSLQSLINGAIKSFDILSDKDKQQIEDARHHKAVIHADLQAELTHIISKEAQIAINMENLRKQFRALADVVRAEEAKTCIAAITNLIISTDRRTS